MDLDLKEKLDIKCASLLNLKLEALAPFKCYTAWCVDTMFRQGHRWFGWIGHHTLGTTSGPSHHNAFLRDKGYHICPICASGTI
jgi:hypothetical protein